MLWWKKKKYEPIIEYRQPTEVEQMQLERRHRCLARLERLRKAHDAKLWARIREVETSIAPQLQEIQTLRAQLLIPPSYAQFQNMALFQQAAQASSPFSAFHGLMNPLAGLGMSALGRPQ